MLHSQGRVTLFFSTQAHPASHGASCRLELLLDPGPSSRAVDRSHSLAHYPPTPLGWTTAALSQGPIQHGFIHALLLLHRQSPYAGLELPDLGGLALCFFPIWRQHPTKVVTKYAWVRPG
ncbi:hypothetical protein BDZ45DRAFT_51036 [Acephala macrosclerotiorum]|nr:hypothetical protein BDZ45DRAFT_51036 [Acephala macrosclerotiorum]